MGLFLQIVCLSILCYVQCQRESEYSLNWECVKGNQCRRVIGNASDNKMSMGVCRLTCGNGNTLWPYPSGKVTISKELVPIQNVPMNIRMSFANQGNSTSECQSAVEEMANLLFEEMLTKRFASSSSVRGPSFEMLIEVEDQSMEFGLDTYEGYLLEKRDPQGNQLPQVRIAAENFFGVRNGFVTFLQLITRDELRNILVMPKTFRITDQPKYPVRSVMIDTGHNFMTVDSIRHLMIGLSLSKINTVHWHISDWQSFPMESASYPKLALYGAYSGTQTYSSFDMRSLAAFAKVLGIRLIPEISIPGRMGSGWQWGSFHGLGELIVCFEEGEIYRCSEPPCGQLNILNENARKIVSTLYGELFALFGKGVYHLGGADVELQCWENLTPDKAYQWWAKLLNDIADELISNGNQVVVFSNPLLNDTKEWLPPSKFIIQVTEDDPAYVKNLISKGYRVILSPYNRTRWDCGFSVWSRYLKKSCSTPVQGWQEAYDIKTPKESGLVLGGEGLLYSSGSHSYNTEELILMNGAALAERFWTDPRTDYLAAFPRIALHSWRLKRFGFHALSIEPFWCTQNVGKCQIEE